MSKKIAKDKELHATAVKNRRDLPLFFKPWWLKAVCGDDWQVLLYLESDQVIAIYTFLPRRKWGFDYVSMPELTRFMGPLFLKEFSVRKKQKILMEMLKALPDFDGFEQTLHYRIKDWLPFSWSGYQQTSRYSFVLPDIRNLEQVRQGLSPKYRNNKIRRALEHLQFVNQDNLGLAWAFFEAPFSRQGIQLPLSEKTFRRLVEVALERACGGIYAVKDEDGKSWANAFVVWDEDIAYLLMLGEHPEGRSSFAGIGLIWFLIEYLSKDRKIREFDFLGSMDRNIARVRQDFGAEQRTYFAISRDKPMFSMMKRLKR